jgi:energy-coupling factor transport system ATP-binding protein
MIQVRRLCYTHPGDIFALRDVDLEIHPGERLAIIGPNGSGKSTLARCLNGLYSPTSGEVQVDGLSTADPDSLFEVRRRVGMVFQSPDDQLVATTVESEIAFGLENLAVPVPDMRQRVDEVLAAFHLEAYRHHPPHRLSGGEKQRVAIAACVALRPRYLVLDEPTSLLDPENRRATAALLEGLRDRFGVATVHITQAPEEAAQSERVLVLHQGRLVEDGPPARIFAAAARLRGIGLDLPFAASVGVRLAEGGAAWAAAPLTLEALAEALTARAAAGPPAVQALAETPASAAPTAKLATEELSYVYDPGLPTQHAGLERVSLVVPDNAIAALVGPSGSGKTTLAQHFNGLLRPEHGRVLLDREDIWSRPREMVQLRRRVGLVFQFPELQLFEETVALDVAFGPRNLAIDPARIEALVTRSLETVGLPPDRFADRSPLSLSGGEKRRVALAGVLAMDPEVLVLDEPTAGLDPGAARALAEVFRRLREGGTTLVLITHDLDLVAGLATHVAVLQQGRVRLCGPMRQILADPDFPELSGLEAPAPVRLARALATRGLTVPPGAVTLEELVLALTAVKTNDANDRRRGDGDLQR